MKRVFSLLLCLVLCLPLFSCGKDDDLDFISDSLKPYIDFDLSDITGGNYTLEDEYGTLDAISVARKFRADRLSAATGYEDGLKTEGTPVFGDAAHLYYEIALTEGGEGSFSNLYTGEGTQTLFIGYWEVLDKLSARDEYPPIFYNEALTSYVSKMTVIPHVTEGTVAQGDKVRVNYKRYNDKDTLLGEAQNIRIDTGALDLYKDLPYPSFLLNSLVGKTIGEEYTVSGTETVTNEDGTTTTATFKYVVTPAYVVEEHFETVAITVPSDAYLPEDGEALMALNGKTVYFRLMLESFYKFNTPALDDDFLHKTYGFVTGEREADAILRAATEKYIERMTAKRAEALKSQALITVMSKLLENGGVKYRPQVQYEQYYNEMLDMLGERYNEAKKYAEEQGQDFTMSLEEYSIYYLTYYNMYSAEVYSSLQEYIDEQAKQKLDARILLIGAAEVAGLRLKPEGYRAIFEEELQKSLEEQNASAETPVTREELIESAGGEEAVMLAIILDHAERVLEDYVYKNNTWTVKDVSKS